VRQVLEAGARGMVEKSSPFDILLKAIEAVAAGRAFFGEAVTQALQRSFVDPVATASSDSLTVREREVLQLVAEGESNKGVAARLGISVKTAEKPPAQSHAQARRAQRLRSHARGFSPRPGADRSSAIGLNHPSQIGLLSRRRRAPHAFTSSRHERRSWSNLSIS